MTNSVTTTCTTVPMKGKKGTGRKVKVTTRAPALLAVLLWNVSINVITTDPTHYQDVTLQDVRQIGKDFGILTKQDWRYVRLVAHTGIGKNKIPAWCPVKGWIKMVPVVVGLVDDLLETMSDV